MSALPIEIALPPAAAPVACDVAAMLSVLPASGSGTSAAPSASLAHLTATGSAAAVSGFLAPLDEVVRTGKVPAQVLLDKFHGEWAGDLTRVFDEAEIPHAVGIGRVGFARLLGADDDRTLRRARQRPRGGARAGWQ